VVHQARYAPSIFVKAAVATRFGGPDALKLEEVGEPLVGSRDVLVDVRAASLNPVDAKIREGGLKLVLRTRPPMILGCDVAGVVRAVGDGVGRFRVGDEVYGRLEKARMGGLAEQVAANEDVLALKPKSIGFDEAAALPLVTLTALQCLRERARLEHGQRVLIHAAAGGLGSVAVQIAKIMGLHVVATASSKNHAHVRELGADELIDYTKEDLSARGPVDAVLESIGGASELASLRACKRGGIVVGVAGLPDIAFARSSMPWFAPAGIWWMTRARRAEEKRTGVRYVWIFMRPDAAQLQEIAGWVDEGKLRPVIHRVYPLAEVTEAFAELERGRSRGKIVIHVS
jgi:NADPH:quinone reductase-like Zn-dependent oxidoreductase